MLKHKGNLLISITLKHFIFVIHFSISASVMAFVMKG